MRLILLIIGLPIFSVACAQSKVRSTVDAYGESELQRDTPLCFVRESRPLNDRPVIDSCRQAAQSVGIPIATDQQNCQFVVVEQTVDDRTQNVVTSPYLGTSIGYSTYGMGVGTGLGAASATTNVQEYADRQIRLTVYEDPDLKKPIRSIDIRSAGKEVSVPAVAYEMCSAAFKDYPANLRGQVYEVEKNKAIERLQAE